MTRVPGVNTDWPRLLTPNYRLKQSFFTLTGTTPVLLSAGNPSRVLICFTAITGSIVVVSPFNSFDVSTSPRVGSNVKDNMFTFAHHGFLSQSDWYGATTGGTDQLTMWELFWEPISE